MEDLPEVDLTVAICTWNRRDLLARVLEHLESVRIPPNTTWELLVVDNRSTDDTQDLLQRLETPLPLRVSVENRQGKSVACNRVLREARGRIIAWIDDDVLPDDNWLEALLKSFRTHGADIVFGPIRPKWLSDEPPWYSTLFDGKFALLDYGPEPFEAGPGKAFFGANYAGKADVLRSLGGFNEDMGPNRNSGLDEDSDLYQRALSKGRKLMYEPDAGVLHMIERVRCTKSFQRHRTWKSSRTYYLALVAGDPRVPRIRGIPRYLFRIAFGDLRSFVRAVVKRDASAKFYYELRLDQFAGVLWHSVKTGKASAALKGEDNPAKGS